MANPPGRTHLNSLVFKKSYFSGITDLRVERTREHRLDDILFIAMASVICGAESWNDMEKFGQAKEEWLKRFLQLPNE